MTRHQAQQRVVIGKTFFLKSYHIYLHICSGQWVGVASEKKTIQIWLLQRNRGMSNTTYANQSTLTATATGPLGYDSDRDTAEEAYELFTAEVPLAKSQLLIKRNESFCIYNTDALREWKILKYKKITFYKPRYTAYSNTADVPNYSTTKHITFKVPAFRTIKFPTEALNPLGNEDNDLQAYHPVWSANAPAEYELWLLFRWSLPNSNIAEQPWTANNQLPVVIFSFRSVIMEDN
jgi:hypothetical protein